MTAALRVGVASILQETNTFAPTHTTIDAFEKAGLYLGNEAGRHVAGTNTETAGAIEELEAGKAEPVPLIHTWTMPSGRMTGAALSHLGDQLTDAIHDAQRLDGLVLSLHGALAAEDRDSGDAYLLSKARLALGSSVPIMVSFDMHANVTTEMITCADAIVGYQTYPHIDMAATGRRAASLVLRRLSEGTNPVSRLAKRPLLLAPETHAADGPFGALRAMADQMLASEDVLDISFFPPQPWLDVEDLGLGVVVTTDGNPHLAQRLADELADDVWNVRTAFRVDLVSPQEAIERVRQSRERPVILIHGADAPSAGAPGDSPVMIDALSRYGADLRAYETVVDAPAVALCYGVGEGAVISTNVGAGAGEQYYRPTAIEGIVVRLGEGPYRLAGPAFTGMQVTMGRWAVVRTGNLSVLLSEAPACTFDPETFRHVGLEPSQADAIVVRSIHLFRAGFPQSEAVGVDLPGASTSRLSSLEFRRASDDLFIVGA